jgi:hypothetical protein
MTKQPIAVRGAWEPGRRRLSAPVLLSLIGPPRTEGVGVNHWRLTVYYLLSNFRLRALAQSVVVPLSAGRDPGSVMR